MESALIFMLLYKVYRTVIIKNYHRFVYLGRFSPCDEGVYLTYTTEEQDQNRLKPYDPVGNIYY